MKDFPLQQSLLAPAPFYKHNPARLFASILTHVHARLPVQTTKPLMPIQLPDTPRPWRTARRHRRSLMSTTRIDESVSCEGSVPRKHTT